MLKVTILGCGSSGGVPLIGERWGLCDPEEPRNRRRRSAILMELGETCVLVDTGPDIKDQLNDLNRGEGGLKIDGIFYTHEHADHVAGIDDLRFLAYDKGNQIVAYAKERCREILLSRFDYIFKGRDGFRISYPAIMTLRHWPDDMIIGTMRIRTWKQEHGDISSQGIRVGQFAYSTDVSHIATEDLHALRGIDTWVVGCVRKEPHPAHASLNRVLQWAYVVQPRQLYLTHLTGLADYRTWNRETPDFVACAYDGLVFHVPL